MTQDQTQTQRNLESIKSGVLRAYRVLGGNESTSRPQCIQAFAALQKDLQHHSVMLTSHKSSERSQASRNQQEFQDQ